MTSNTSHPPLSYILCEARLDQGHGSLRELELPCGRYLYHCPELDVGHSLNPVSTNFVVCIGLVMDTSRGAIDNSQVSGLLLEQLDKGEECFLDALDRISGRYVVLYGNTLNRQARVVGDCFGSLKITYNRYFRAVSSNIFLINRFFEDGVRALSRQYSENRKDWTYGSLGSFQPLNNYSILTPNHCLDLSSFQQHRFYPRRRLDEASDIDYISGHLIDDTSRQLALLADGYFLFQSLTAGLDSRTSLALNDRPADTVFFTYLFQEPHAVDAKVSVEIARRLGLNHRVLVGPGSMDEGLEGISGPSTIVHATPNEEFIRQVKAWDWYSHGNKQVSAYRHELIGSQDFSPKRPLHIRSNLYETGRAYWGKSELFDQDEILHRTRRDWAKHGAIFDSYFRESEYGLAADCGYNLLDIFYWEHRCGTWVSEVTQGTDFAFNTHCFINSRKSLELLLGVNFKDRKEATVFKRIIDQKLPALANFPINPK